MKVVGDPFCLDYVTNSLLPPTFFFSLFVYTFVLLYVVVCLCFYYLNSCIQIFLLKERYLMTVS